MQNNPTKLVYLLLGTGFGKIAATLCFSQSDRWHDLVRVCHRVRIGVVACMVFYYFSVTSGRVASRFIAERFPRGRHAARSSVAIWLCARRPPVYIYRRFIALYLQQRMWKRAIKAFQNLQLTEHHIDSLQQSAADAGGDERRGAARLARRARALLRHRPPYIPGPHHGADGVLVPVRAAQLPAAGVGRAAVHVQRAVPRRSRRGRHGGLLPCARRRPAALLRQHGTSTLSLSAPFLYSRGAFSTPSLLDKIFSLAPCPYMLILQVTKSSKRSTELAHYVVPSA